MYFPPITDSFSSYHNQHFISEAKCLQNKEIVSSRCFVYALYAFPCQSGSWTSKFCPVCSLKLKFKVNLNQQCLWGVKRPDFACTKIIIIFRILHDKLYVLLQVRRGCYQKCGCYSFYAKEGYLAKKDEIKTIGDAWQSSEKSKISG